jgi:hypothetical protein
MASGARFNPAPRLLAALVGVFFLVSACTTAVQKVSDPVSTTTTSTTPATATTLAPGPGTFLVATPLTSPQSYSATPGGPPEGVLPTLTWGNQTVRPVVSQANGWVQIALDSKPNGSTGWLPESAVNVAVTAYRIQISISAHSLTLFKDGQQVYSSPVGVGEPQWPTPMGRTFVDAVVTTPKQQVYIYGPTVVVLGTHSNVFTDFDGGDGTVAIHGYPSDPGSTEGVASSHGCVRADPQTIDAIDVIPLGSPVDVVA